MWCKYIHLRFINLFNATNKHKKSRGYTNIHIRFYIFIFDQISLFLIQYIFISGWYWLSLGLWSGRWPFHSGWYLFLGHGMWYAVAVGGLHESRYVLDRTNVTEANKWFEDRREWFLSKIKSTEYRLSL